MKKYLFWILFTLVNSSMYATEYIDLGLPSGTLWATKTQYSNMTWDNAISRFGNRVPTMNQYKELLAHCKVDRVTNNKTYFTVDCIVIFS